MKRRFTILTAAFALLAILAIPMGMMGQTTVSYGWETSDDASQWTITDAIVATSGQGNTGTYAGKINTNHTYVQFNEKVFVTSFSFAFKRTSNNSNYNVYIETSTDGDTWTAVETYAMGSFSNGTYSTKTHTFDGTTEYYVRFHCYNTTAVRYVDDISITYTTGAATVATPTFSLASGSYIGAQSLTISCETQGSTIYYTTDGSTPDNTSTQYTGAISVSETTTINAIAYVGNDASNVATATYTIVNLEHAGTEADPYTVADAHTAIDANVGITGVYATGIVSAIPTAWNSQYSNITFNFVDEEGDNNFLQAYRCISGTGVDASEVSVGDSIVVYGNLTKYNSTYEFTSGCQVVSLTHPAVAVEAPTFSPIAGTYAEAQSVTISCETNGAVIYYTTDGSLPGTSNSSTLYENPITVSSTMTIKAVAVMGQYTSNMATATYHICSAENPYTVTEALAFSEYPANSIFVTGIVSTAPTSLSSGTLTYYISDNGEATNQLEVYKGKDLNNEAFTAADDIQVGDIVTVYGNVVEYTSGGTTILEFASGNYLVSFERPTPVLEEYDLTVSTLNDHINAIYVFNAEDENNPLIEEGLAGTVQVLEGTDIMVSPDVEEGYVLASLTVLDGEGTSVQPEDHMSDGGYYSFTMPSGPVTITATAMVAPATVDYELYSGALVEGDYIIYYNGYAMNHTVTSGRLQYETVTPNNNVITTSSAEIVWHIAPSATEGYWTIYSDDAQAYAAGTGVKNKAQMLAELNDNNNDMALWSVTVAESKDNTYEFVNKYNYDNNINHLLRNNGTNGFACYAAATGGALSLYKKVVEPTTETHTLTIDGYTDDNVKNGYYLIASPVTVNPADVEGLTEGTFDLYYYDDTQDLEWINYETQNGINADFGNLVPGQGYLYAKKAMTENQTYSFNLTGMPYNGDGEIDLIAGWNLVGNPFGQEAEISMDYYAMNQDGSELTPVTASTNVAAMQGVFVYSAEAGTVMFMPAETGTNTGDDKLVLNVTRNRGNVIDRAIVRFGESSQLPKFQLHENSTKVSIAKDNKDYAVVSSETQGEMSVNFQASENGTYTFSVNTENIEMDYLHLIDNMTGADIDLIATPSYSFEAKTTDYTNRFRLVFNANNGINEQGNENFAFFNGSKLIVNNQGEATLQVVDILGRVISSQNINGNENINLNIKSGAYMIRLINGNDVKTQKIVVE